MEDKTRQEKSPRESHRPSFPTTLPAREGTVQPLLSTTAGCAPCWRRSCTTRRWPHPHSAAQRRAVTGHPVHIPRLEVDVGLVEEESHHPLPATPGCLHQRCPALPVLGVGVQALGQQVLNATQVALSARPEELGLAQGANGTILVKEDYLLQISNLLYSVLDPSYPIRSHG